jgi:hypothetical protein
MAFIKVKIDTSDALNALTAAAKQVEYATAVALTKTAQAVKAGERAEMQRVFVSAVPFTLNSLYVKSATRTDLVATVGIKDQGRSAINWLSTEIKGGARPSGIEVFLKPIGLPPSGMYAVPGKEAPMTSNKKLNVSALRKIVSQLQAQPQGLQGMTAIKRKQGRGSTKAQYFALPKPMLGLPAGIFGLKGREVLPIVLFVKRPSYRAKYDFYGVANRIAQEKFPALFHKALADALSSAR